MEVSLGGRYDAPVIMLPRLPGMRFPGRVNELSNIHIYAYIATAVANARVGNWA